MANTPIFAVGTHDKILPLVEAGTLTYPSYIFCRDTDTIAFLDSELNIHDAVGWNQNQIITVDTLPAADTARTDAFYIYDGKGYLYINGLPVPVFRDISKGSSYDELTDIPIVNKYGTSAEPLVVADLNPGTYTISGTYKIGGNLTTKYVTSRKIIFIVDSDNTNKLITKFSNNKILMYSMNLNTEEVTVTEYATQTWIQEQGFATETYVQQAIDEIYEKLAGKIIVTKISQLENDMGYLTADDLTTISDNEIRCLF